MITLSDLNFRYESNPVLKGLNANFESGCVHGIVGLNGAGKTTFFQVLAGFLAPDSGTIHVDGKPLEKRQVAFLETELYFYPKLSAREFLSVFPLTNQNFDEEKLAALFRLPLDELISNYSTGMRKKLMLLTHIKQDKNLFILDEPFNGLDLEAAKALEVIIGILRERQKTIFVSSHILAPLMHTCDFIHYLNQQKIEQSYSKPEFAQLESDLFGTLTAAWAAELRQML